LISSIKRCPAVTRVSLFARAISFPAFIAAAVGTNPAAPTMAATTMSVSVRVAAATRPSTPDIISVPEPDGSMDFSLPASSSFRTTASLGENLAICFANRSRFAPAVRASTVNLSGWAATMSRVLVPVEPVEPSMVSLFIGVSVKESAGNKSGIVVGCRSCKENTVEPVEYAAMSRDDSSGILYSAAPYYQGFEKIPDLAERTDKKCRQYAVDNRKVGEVDQLCDHSTRDTSGQTEKCTFYALVRTDRRIKLVLSEPAAEKVGGAVAGHDDEENQQYPVQARRVIPQQNQIAEKIRNIDDPEKKERGLGSRFPYIAEPEESVNGNRKEENCESKCHRRSRTEIEEQWNHNAGC